MFRSDQLAWAQAGIPAAWIDGGTDYVGRPPGWGVAKRASTVPGPTITHDDVRADFDYSGLVQLAEITAALVQQIGAGATSAWKSDPNSWA